MPFVSTFSRHMKSHKTEKKTPFKDIQTKWRINKKKRKEMQNKTNICKNIKSH